MVWDKKRSSSKCLWKKNGVLLTEQFNTFDELYNYYLSINNCELCNISFEECKKCLDHCHTTGLFRNIVCNSCNRIKAVGNKNNYMNIKYVSKIIAKKKGTPSEVYRIQFIRKGKKYFKQIRCNKITLDEIILLRNNMLLDVDGNLDSIKQ